MPLKIIKLLIVCFICTGCSTLATLDERSDKKWPYIEMYNECNVYEKFGIKQQMVYSGSRNALSYIVWPFKCFGEGCWGAIIYPITLPYSLVDLTFSAIADTIVLPHTYNIQYNECPKVNLSELMKTYLLLEERLRLYRSDYSNPEHVWLFSSDNFKRNRTKYEFIKYLNVNNHMIKNTDSKYTPEIMSIAGDKAIVRWWNSTAFTINDSIFEYWVYERNNWYLNQPNRKGIIRIKEEMKSLNLFMVNPTAVQDNLIFCSTPHQSRLLDR